MTTVRWALTDTWTIARRDFARWARQPAPVVIGLLFPVLVVLMFGYLFGGAIQVPGGADYREYLMPGAFAMAMLFGIETTMVAVSTDAARGVTDRFRSLPMAPSGVVAGRSVADLAHSLVGLAVLIGCGLLIGWRAHGSPAETALAIGLLVLLRFAMLWFGIYLGLVVRGPESVAAVQILVWPVAFLASTFVPPQTMPGVLGTLAEWNPLSATISATRDLFGNPDAPADSWVTQHALLMAIVWPVLIVAVFLPLAVRRYARGGG
ncbi:MAG TPA: ABC transporter permease [Actinophytocola sp.]|uniref:ABC transporter permease n=1 Tax=Actinophytocola sp. TaxID=1872138 RepID=UPI002DBA03C3|nr:ABC transporter permease [Actinophytocola sp.]HEU5475379.1 ABC transporter permease [Actinophytocola sp.]